MECFLKKEKKKLKKAKLRLYSEHDLQLDHNDGQILSMMEWLMVFVKVPLYNVGNYFSMVFNHWSNNCSQWFYNGFWSNNHCTQWFFNGFQW